MPTMFSFAIRPVMEATTPASCPSQEEQISSDSIADCGKDGVVDLVLGEHTERAVNTTEVSGEPNKG